MSDAAPMPPTQGQGAWENDATPTALTYVGLSDDGGPRTTAQQQQQGSAARADRERQAQQAMHRLAPSAPIASATKLPARSG